jgi:hypothetical protein
VDENKRALDGEDIVTEAEALAFLIKTYPDKAWSVFAPLGIGLPCIDKVILYHPCELTEEAITAAVPHLIELVTPRRMA